MMYLNNYEMCNEFSVSVRDCLEFEHKKIFIKTIEQLGHWVAPSMWAENAHCSRPRFYSSSIALYCMSSSYLSVPTVK